MPVDPEQLHAAATTVTQRLLDARGGEHHWTGELSTSALSTATAVMALEQVRRANVQWTNRTTLDQLIAGGIAWLTEHQNRDGGWGDTLLSLSNISTTMLCHATLTAILGPGGTAMTASDDTRQTRSIERAKVYIDAAGGVPAVVARYGKDKTFSIPILTHCALAGLVDWRSITPLPFELACLPAKFYKTVRLPVVSYALPALIAIGQVRHHFAPTWNPITRFLRNRSISRSLAVLERIQPSNGGFLEAAPLTSFVTMALAAKGLAEHQVVRKGVAFLIDSVRPDGSWPIDTNLSTWVTTLSINGLGDALPAESREPLSRWLLDQQYQEVHPFTNAAPGGWSWTPLPGGVPDADDTPGAMLALMQLEEPGSGENLALRRAAQWLLDVQNRDGGFPTFCRGWGTLPFDRSSPDITAHCVRALFEVAKPWSLRTDDCDEIDCPEWANQAMLGWYRAVRYLERCQQPEGSWLPLWFGNQSAPDDINPTYGTAKVLAMYRDTGSLHSAAAQRGLAFLRGIQNEDGGWGAGPGTESSVEETALATEILLEDPLAVDHVDGGLTWLIARVKAGTIGDPAPIGFYFAKLWYFERLYPLVFAVACLQRATTKSGGSNHC